MGRRPKDNLDLELQKILRAIGANVRQLRGEKGMTQSGVAKLAKVSITTLNEIETRRFRDIRLSTLCSIARALSIPFSHLLSESDLKLRQSDQMRLLKASEEILSITRKLKDD